MASNDELQKLASKLMSDANYRARFLADPQAAAADLGVRLSEDQLRKAREFKGDEAALQRMAAQAGVGVNAAWGGE